MEQTKLLRRFYGRLLAEALLFAVLNGLICGAGVVFIVSFVYHLLLLDPGVSVMLCIFGGVFGLCFLGCMLLRYPTNRRIAARLDEAGLQERAGTMLAFAKESSTLVRLQRKDAREHIAATSPRKLPFRFNKKRGLICLVAVVLAVGMLLLPANAFAPGSGMSPEEAARAKAVEELIDQLRQQVMSSKLPEHLQQTLENILDQLEQALLATDSQLEQAILIEQAVQDMQNAMSAVLSRYQIGTALQRFELTRTLGQQVCDGDTRAIPLTLDQLEDSLNQTAANVTKLSNNIELALEDSGIPASDMLYMAFEGFSRDLAALSYSKNPLPEDEESGILPDPNDPDALAAVFATAEMEILAALDEQALLEAEMENVTSGLQDGCQELLGGSTTQVGGQDDSGSGGGNMDESAQSGEQSDAGSSAGTAGGMASGPSNSTRDTMLEGIYDPISGSVTYGEVFAAYYAQYLQALDAGEVSQELQELIDQYYSALS